MMDVAIEVVDVYKKFRVYHVRHRSLKDYLLLRRDRYEEYMALRGVSISIPRGSTVGIIGTNGSGKSTLLKIIAGILQPTKGLVRVRGSVAALLELGAGFHPDFTGRENAYLYASLLGLSRRLIDKRIEQIKEFSELGPFFDMPVKTYSSGMYMRLGFSVAMNVDPDILLLDEVLAVGDEGFQRKCLDAIRKFQTQGKTIVLVAHSSQIVQEFCQHAVWLDQGRVCYAGDVQEALAAYHAYLAGADRGGEQQ